MNNAAHGSRMPLGARLAACAAAGALLMALAGGCSSSGATADKSAATDAAAKADNPHPTVFTPPKSTMTPPGVPPPETVAPQAGRTLRRG